MNAYEFGYTLGTKRAAARWRRPENLQKILEAIEISDLKPGHSLLYGGHEYPRLEALQKAVDYLGLDRQPGQAYQRFSDSLRWHKPPEKARQAVLDSMTEFTPPRYLFRGIAPDSRIGDVFATASGNRAPFVHASPSPGVAMDMYGKVFGSGNQPTGKLMQVFRSRADQAYLPDFSAEWLHSEPARLKNYTWDKSRRWLEQGAEEIEDFWKKRSLTGEGKYVPQPFEPQYQSFTRNAYETPVFQNNKGLGTYLVRRTPGAYGPSLPTVKDDLAQFLEHHEFARIPQSRKLEALNLAKEQQRVINTRGAAAREYQLANRPKKLPALAASRAPAAASVPTAAPPPMAAPTPTPAPVSAPVPSTVSAPPQPAPKSIPASISAATPTPKPAPTPKPEVFRDVSRAFRESIPPGGGVSPIGRAPGSGGTGGIPPKMPSSSPGTRPALSKLLDSLVPVGATIGAGAGIGAYRAPSGFKEEGARRGAIRGAATGIGGTLGHALARLVTAKPIPRLGGAVIGSALGYGGSGAALGAPSWQKLVAAKKK